MLYMLDRNTCFTMMLFGIDLICIEKLYADIFTLWIVVRPYNICYISLFTGHDKDFREQATIGDDDMNDSIFCKCTYNRINIVIFIFFSLYSREA